MRKDLYMPEGGEAPRPEETDRLIADVDAVLASNNRQRESLQGPRQPVDTGLERTPFRGLGEDAETYRDRFDRLLALSVGKRSEVRRNQDGSKTLLAFLRVNAKDALEIMKLREAAATAGVKEAFAPLLLRDETSGDSHMHLGYEETIPKNALPGRLQDPPHSQPEDDNTRETPL
jgi:hypothetical protein